MRLVDDAVLPGAAAPPGMAPWIAVGSDHDAVAVHVAVLQPRGRVGYGAIRIEPIAIPQAGRAVHDGLRVAVGAGPQGDGRAAFDLQGERGRRAGGPEPKADLAGRADCRADGRRPVHGACAPSTDAVNSSTARAPTMASRPPHGAAGACGAALSSA